MFDPTSVVRRPGSAVRDQFKFDQIIRSAARKSPSRPLLLMDTNLRIRGVSDAYERATLRDRGELLGLPVFEAFPDNPNDQQARGTSDLGASFETAMRTGRSHHMWVLRYDIPNPVNSAAFIPRVWAPHNSPVRDHGQLVGVLHQANEITELHSALSAIARAIEANDAVSPLEQLHTLAAFSAALPGDPQHQQALVAENEQLRRALETRDTIGQAKGMLMERYGIDANAAFGLLVKLSQSSNTKVVEIACKLLEIDHPSTSADT